MFLWRLAQNSLPTRLNIKRKQIDLDTRCPMCHRLDKDGDHIFLKCKMVKEVWREQCLEEVRLTLCECSSAREAVQAICSLPADKQLRVAVLLWDWWTSRNKVNAGEKPKTPVEVSSFISKHVLEFSPEVKNQPETHPQMETSTTRLSESELRCSF